ncbi:unnamed protein product [Trifolium pratense]|uniref:Uncharacterized protein n=1 Tax=Trifolium pratense TaxID=57577 RepID=A0ACB0IB52_TRIPR|nr:unnamed protein product [Trifolium pratense]
MDEENKVTAEQLSTMERLVKLSILFTAVTQFLFSILQIALPPPPTTKSYIMLFTALSSTWFVKTMLMYDIVNDLIQTHNQNNENIICSMFSILTTILCVVCSGLQLFKALDSLLVIICTNICYAILPFYMLSVIWLGIMAFMYSS